MIKRILFFLLIPFLTKAQVIVTIAGTGMGAYGGDGSTALTSELYLPSGAAFDNLGNLFIADFHNNAIREISTSGIITTVAGNGTPGYGGDNGPATAALLNTPRSVAIDGSGNIFIADYANSVIREVNTSGIITTVAGNSASGFGGDGAAATNASLNYPSGIAVDGSGNIFIADFINNRIRMVSAAGIISTVAGTGTSGFAGDGAAATNAMLNYPTAAAVDGSGNLFIADYLNNCIRKVSSGIITTVAGNDTAGYRGDGGPATTAELYYPQGVTVDGSGNLFIADAGNNVIREVSSTGLIFTVAGNDTAGFSGDDGPATAAELNNPMCVAVDDSGELFIADYANNRIREVTSSTTIGALHIMQPKNANSSITLFPNPNTGVFTLKGSFDATTPEQVSLEVLDMLGQVVYKTNIATNNGSINTQITLNDIANGIYLLQVISGQEKIISRLVIGK